MYALTPLKVYALDQVRDDSACMTRMERILRALGKTTGDLVWITDESLPDVVEELQNLWPPESVPEGQIRSFMRPIVFTRTDLSYTWPDLTPSSRAAPPARRLGSEKIYGQMTPPSTSTRTISTSGTTVFAGRRSTSARSAGARTAASIAARAGAASS